MRWESLFADLEGELAAADAAALDLEVRDRTRREVARLTLVDRLRPAVGLPVAVTVAGAGVLRGRLARVGPDWLLIEGPAGADVVVALAAVLGVTGLGAHSTTPGTAGAVASRLGLGYALRGLASRRVAVSVALVDGSTCAGTLDRVGADLVELAEHPPGEPRRTAEVRAVRAVPFAAIAVVRGT